MSNGTGIDLAVRNKSSVITKVGLWRQINPIENLREREPQNRAALGRADTKSKIFVIKSVIGKLLRNRQQ